jgi:hypothetical protein
VGSDKLRVQKPQQTALKRGGARRLRWTTSGFSRPADWRRQGHPGSSAQVPQARLIFAPPDPIYSFTAPLRKFVKSASAPTSHHLLIPPSNASPLSPSKRRPFFQTRSNPSSPQHLVVHLDASILCHQSPRTIHTRRHLLLPAGHRKATPLFPHSQSQQNATDWPRRQPCPVTCYPHVT